ncbi:MAG: peptidase, partial [Natronospirillum sp.]
ATIGGALKKIGGSAYGSKLASGHAPEFSHLFFSQAVSVGFNRLLATHPPLEDRIRRVEPGWNGKYILPVKANAEETVHSDPHAEASADLEQRRNILTGAVAAGVLSGQSAQRAIASIGQPGTDHLDYAQQVLGELGDELIAAAHEPFAARALIYALLLSPDAGIRAEQLRTLEAMALPDVYRELTVHKDAVLALAPECRLPLLELTIPALKDISADQYRTFKQCMNALVRADGAVDLLEWTLYHILIYNLEAVPPAPASQSLKSLPTECAVLLTVLARAGGYDDVDARAAVSVATEQLPFVVTLQSESDSRIGRLTEALRKLRQLKPLEKPALLKAMARCIEHNGAISAAEAELFRAVGE